MRDTFLECGGVVARLLREPVLVRRWSDGSALPDFSVGGLARHLANQVTASVPLLAAVPDGAVPVVPVLAHFTGNPWVTSGVDSADNVGIRRRGEAAAARQTPGELVVEVDGALRTLRGVLAAGPADRVVGLGDWALALPDFLLTRVVEMVVHVDDLAVSLGLPTPDLPADAVEAAVGLLARLAVWRHGPVAVVRALARRERAPESVAAL